MKIILLDKVKNLGNMGMEVHVKPGYARNFLIPQSKAIVATKKNIEIFNKKKSEMQLELTDRLNQAQSYSEIINRLGSVTIAVKSGISGKLFGSVGARDIADEITKKSGIKIMKSQIRLPNRSVLRSIGTYNIVVHIYDEIFSKLDVIVSNILSVNNK